MKKTILVNYTGKKGGGVLDAYEMARALIQNGENVYAVLSDAIENISDWKKLPLKGICLIPTYMSKREFLSNSVLFGVRQRKIICDYFEDIHIDVIYCPMDTLWQHRVSKCFPRAKLVLASHDPIAHSGVNYYEKFLFERNIRRADAVIVHTKKFKKYVEDHFHRATYYVPLGRHSLYRQLKDKREIISYNPQKINFLFFGRITPYKGLDVLADAYRRIQSKYKEQVTISIVGDGDFSEYQEAYSSLPNVNIINRWVYDEEVESIFSGDNIVCVCPYKDATQSGVVLVAMDYGVPVIASNTGGLDEQIENGVTGILVSNNDVNELVEAMERLIVDEEMRKNIGENGMRFVEEMSWDKSAYELLKVFSEI